jgi:UDP-glucuronate decarboxylase
VLGGAQFDPVQTTKTSVHGAINMLGLAKRVKARILQASTSEVYGDPEVHPQPESYWGKVNPIGTRGCYDEGKRCAETLFFDYYRQHNIDIEVIRIFNTYGPRMHPNDGRIVSNFVVQALRGEDLTIYGEGQQTRSFCYVDDLVEGMPRMMDTEGGFTGPVNLGNPTEFTMLELAEKVIPLVGTKSKLVHRPLPQDDPCERKPDISLAQAKLGGWTPRARSSGARGEPLRGKMRRKMHRKSKLALGAVQGEQTAGDAILGHEKSELVTPAAECRALNSVGSPNPRQSPVDSAVFSAEKGFPS